MPTLKITDDDKAAMRSLDKLDAKIDKLEGKMKQAGRAAKGTGDKLAETGKKGQRAGEETNKAFDPKNIKAAAGALIGVASGAAAVTGAMRLINAEIRQAIELQKKAAAAQLTVNQARMDVVRNLPGVSQADVAATLKTGERIAADTKIEEKFIQSAMAEALSASGGDRPGSAAAVRQVAKFLADRPEMIAGYSGSLLDLSKVTGSADAKVNQGFLSFVGGMSRVVNPQQQAMNIPRALIGAQSYGATMQGGAALFAALTTGSADIRGATSGTALIALSEQLKGFLPSEDATMGERVRYLQKRPEKAQEFLEQASFEKVAKGPIRQLLLDSNSEIAKQYTENLAKIPGIAGLGRVADEMLRNRMADPLERGQRQRRAYGSGETQLLVSDLVGATGEINREGMANLLRATGMGSLATKISGMEFEFDTRLGRKGARETAISTLELRLWELENPRVPYTTMYGGGSTPRDPTEREGHMAGILQSILVELRNANQARQTPLGRPDDGEPPKP